MTPQHPSTPMSTTVDRAGALLQLLAQNPHGLGISRLTRELGTQRAPLYRILNALISHGLVRRDERKQYLLGVGILELARAYQSQFPSGMEALLARLADETGMTATLISVDGDELTTVVSKTPSTNEEHVFTPAGFRHPHGRLSMRTAVEASRPPADTDSDEVKEARRLGYAPPAAMAVVQSRYGSSVVVPGSEASGVILVIALVSLRPFDHTTVAEPLLRTAEAVGHSLAMP